MTPDTAQDTCERFSDEITVVQPFRWERKKSRYVRATATKTFQFDPLCRVWAKVSDYDRHSDVLLMRGPCTSLAELADLIQVIAANDCYIVRGEITEAAEAVMAGDGFCNRRKMPRGSNDHPSLREIARRWLMIDVDDWPIPAYLSLADASDHVLVADAMIRDVCAFPFHDADCWFQWSSSCALQFGDTASAHLWFWLDQPEKNERLRSYTIANMPGVDYAPFNAVQPHYVTPPVLIGGHDPMPARTGWRRGLHPMVTMPSFVSPRTNEGNRPTGGSSTGASWAEPLCHVGDDKRRFYAPIRDAIWRYSGLIDRGATSNNPKVIRVIQQVVVEASRSPARNIERYMNAEWLQQMIDQAVWKRRAQRVGGAGA